MSFNIFTITDRGKKVVRSLGGRMPSDKGMAIKILYDLYRFKNSSSDQIASRVGEPEYRITTQLSILRQKGLVQSLV